LLTAALLAALCLTSSLPTRAEDPGTDNEPKRAYNPDDPRFKNKSIDQLAEEGYWGSTWAQHKAMLGKPPPQMVLQQWLNGTPGPNDLRNRVVVIEFETQWNASSLPNNAKINNDFLDTYGKRPGAPAILFAAAVQPDADDVDLPALVRTSGIHYPVARTDTGTKERLKIGHYPFLMVIDRKGNIRAIGLQRQYLEPLVDKLLAEGPQPPPPKPPNPPASRPTAPPKPKNPPPPTSRPTTRPHTSG
jgi:hypothetical protein